MAPKPTTALLLHLLPLLLLLSPATAHNITRILEQFPEFSVFNSLLNQTKVAEKINQRTTITVLAVDNGAAGGLSGQSPDVLENLLSVHVILDYYDAQKLHRISKRSALVTTLFQSTGLAAGKAGFLNITDLKGGQVAFGSAVNGAGLTVNFVKELATRPYNISVLQVSGVIYPPNINGLVAPPPPPPGLASPPPKKAPVPAPKHSESPAPSEETEAPDASSPAPSEDEADAPATSDSPLASPPSPKGSDEDELAPAGSKSSAGRVVAGASLAVVMGAAFLGALCI